MKLYTLSVRRHYTDSRSRITLSFLVLAILALWSVDAFTQDVAFDDWGHNRKYRDETADSKKLEKLAANGDAEAAFEIGIVCLLESGFRNGKICHQRADASTATIWLHKALQLGYSNPSGEAVAGVRYQAPWIKNDAENNAEALLWLKRSSAHGSPTGILQLGGFQGAHGASASDASNMIDTYRKSAAQGNFQAMYSLGEAYLTGYGVPRDTVTAETWFSETIRKLSNFPNADLVSYEYAIGKSYIDAEETNRGLDYLLRASREIPFQDNSITQQSSLQLLGEIYRDGRGVPVNPLYAATCFNARQTLIDQANALQAARDAQDQANAERNRAANRAMITGALSDLTNSIHSLGTPSPTQSAANNQLANIAATQARAQQSQTAQPQQIASAKPASSFSVQPPTSKSAPNSDTAAAPVANLRPPTAAANINTLCPASGFVPGVMTHPAPDVALGVQCKPGSAIYINGVPQFDITGTGSVNHTGSSAGSDGTNGATTASPTDGPPEAACIQLSADPTNTYPVFHNTCTFAVTYFWTPFKIPPGGYAEQNGILQSGETQTGAENAVGGYRIYACQTNYLVRGTDGSSITGVVSGYRCVKP